MSKKASGTWAPLPKMAVFDPRLSIEAKSVLMIFAACTNGKNTCYPSTDFIGEKLGMKLRTVQRHIKALKDTGYIAQRGKFETPQGYRVELWEVLYPDPKSLEKTSPDGVFEGGKTSPHDTRKTPSTPEKTPLGAEKTSPGDASLYMEQAYKNEPNKTSLVELANITTRRCASSDDDDVPLGADYGFPGYPDEVP